MTTTANVRLPSSDGLLLEGRVRTPDGRARGVVLLLHPHPAFGGTMDVWLLPAIAERLAAEGWVALRVNLRGVGGSAGASTDGREEAADAEGAMAWLGSRWPGLPRAVVGWSFGAMIGLRLGPAVDHWVGIAPPTRHVAGVPLQGPLVPAALPALRTIVVGEHDQFFPPGTGDAIDAASTIVIPGADHFLFDLDIEVAALVAGALRPTLAPTGGTAPPEAEPVRAGAARPAAVHP